MLAVAALVVAHVLATSLVNLSRTVGASIPLSASINRIPFLTSTNWISLSARINRLLNSTLDALQLTSGSAGLVLDALFKASPAVLAAAAALVSLSLYLIRGRWHARSASSGYCSTCTRMRTAG